MNLLGLLPTRRDYAELPRSWKDDLIAGLTVGVVAIPLALAFGVSSGLGATTGLITAIVAGFVAAVFGGSHVQVSGPTGAMTVVLVPLVARYGHNGVLIAGLLAGMMLVAMAAFRLGKYVGLIPWPVVEGFTLGIAVIIFLQQVVAALGVKKPKGENNAAIAYRAVVAFVRHPAAPAIGITLLVVVLMLLVPRLHKSIPASLVAVAVATVVARLTHLHVKTIGAIPSSLPAPRLPGLAFKDLSSLLGPAVAIAALAAIESLLSAKVADGMADGEDHDPDRELFGQGLANVLTPLFGGMPATGAIARTAVNVRAGGRTRLSAALHAVVLVLVVLFLGSVVKIIPLAALAGVLMVTACRMVEVHNVRMLLRSTRSDAIVLGLTAVTTVAFDLVRAVEVGLAVASFLALRAVARSTSFEPEKLPMHDVSVEEERRLLHEHIVAYRLDGALFFGAAQRFLVQLTDVANVRVVILRLGHLQVLDATGAVALADIIERLEHRNITVLICGPQPHHLRLLDQVGVLDRLAHREHLYDQIAPAIEHARRHVKLVEAAASEAVAAAS